MVQATNLASEKDVKIHIQRSANGGNTGAYWLISFSFPPFSPPRTTPYLQMHFLYILGTHHGPGVAVQQGAPQRQVWIQIFVNNFFCGYWPIWAWRACFDSVVGLLIASKVYCAISMFHALNILSTNKKNFSGTILEYPLKL